MTKALLFSVALPLLLVLLLGRLPPIVNADDDDEKSEFSSVLPVAVAVAVPPPPANGTDQLLTVDDDFRSVFEETGALLEFDDPTDLDFSPNFSVLLVADKTGKLWVVENFEGGDGGGDDGAVSIPPPTKTEALDLADRMCINGERGLGGVAFHPEWPEKPFVYLYYTYNKYPDDDCYNGGWQKQEEDSGTGMGTVNRLSRFVLSPSSKTIDLSSEVVFLETPRQPVHNHNGGGIAFGSDGLLYAAIGDGGSFRRKNTVTGVYYSQALNVLLGKVVRLTEDGNIPPDNPFTPSRGHPDSVRCGETEGEATNATTKCQEIFAFGLRNPFRLAFDPNANGANGAHNDDDETSRFYINDVGRSTWERIVEGKRGSNYGYPVQDGPCQNSGKKDENCEPNEFTAHAVHWYRHDDENGGCITGGAFVPDEIGWPASFGRTYLYADYAQGGIYRITRGDGGGCSYPTCDPPVSEHAATRKTLSGALKVVSMKFGPYRGRSALYYVSRGNPSRTEGLFRIAHTGTANRPPTAIIRADVTIGFSPLSVQFDGTDSTDPDGDNLSYAWDLNGDGVADSTSPAISYEYYTGTEVSLTVRDGNGGEGMTSIRIEVDNPPPIPRIESPVEGTTFAVGESFILVGSAEDAEDGNLLDALLVWEVREVHESHVNTHYHPFLDPTPGNHVQIIDAPEPESFDAALTSYLEIRLTATDKKGLSSTTSINIYPKIVEVDIDSFPSGLEVKAYGDTFRTPVTIQTWLGFEFDIEAPTPQTVDGIAYSWAGWSDGGCRSHTYAVHSSKPPSIVAEFISSELASTRGQKESPGHGCESEVSGPEVSGPKVSGPKGDTQSADPEKGGTGAGTEIFLAVFFPVVAVAVCVIILFRQRKTRSFDREENMGHCRKGTHMSDMSERSGASVPPPPPPPPLP